MASVSKKEIIQKMEELKEGSRLRFRLGATFGGGVVLIELNPSHNQSGQKKFLMWWGDDEMKARAKDPFMTSDKAKHIAAWPADRDPQWLV